MRDNEKARFELFDAVNLLVQQGEEAYVNGKGLNPEDYQTAVGFLQNSAACTPKQLGFIYSLMRKYYHPLKALGTNSYNITAPYWREFRVTGNNQGSFDFDFDRTVIDTIKAQPFQKEFNRISNMWDVWDFGGEEIKTFCEKYNFNIQNPERLVGLPIPASRKPIAYFEIPVDDPNVMLMRFPYNKEQNNQFKDVVPISARTAKKTPFFHWEIPLRGIPNMRELMRWCSFHQIRPHGFEAQRLAKEVITPIAPRPVPAPKPAAKPPVSTPDENGYYLRPIKKQTDAEFDNTDTSFDFAVEN